MSPVGIGREASWEGLLAGRSGIDLIKSFDASNHSTQIAAEIDEFDPENYMDRKKAKRMDRFAQLACAASLEAMSHAGITIEDVDPTRFAVIIGSGVGGIKTLSEQYDMSACPSNTALKMPCHHLRNLLPPQEYRRLYKSQ